MQRPGFNFTRVFRIIAIALVLSFVFSQFFVKNEANAAIGINRQINFQGKLVNNPSSTNVANTNYTVVFTLYDNASGGTALWTETQSVTTVDGIFRVALGSVTPFPANFNFNWSGLYLGIKVNADSEMTPRIQMAAVPFAFNAEKVAGLTVQDTSGNASTSGTLQIANAKTINLGTQNLTFTTTADTTLTLPTTGTLSTLAGIETLTNKTIGSTGLTFTGAATDITTGTNQDFILFPNGTGRVGIFSPSGVTPLSSLDVRSNPVTGGIISVASVSGQTSFASLVVNNDGVGDLFTASKSGLPIFTVKNNGQLVVGAPYYQTGSCTLKTDTAGLVTCGTDLQGGGVNWWNQLAGALSPVDTTNDLLIGSTATSSALFSFTGVKTGQTIASISGQLIVMPNNGWGGNVGIGTTTPNAKLDIKDSGSLFSVGTEMIINSNDRDFTNDTGKWTTSGSPPWKIDTANSNIATKDAPGTGAITLDNSALTSSPVSGAYYQITVSITTTASSSGSITPSIGGTSGTPTGQGISQNYPGQIIVIKAVNSSSLTFTPTSGWYGTLDNIFVKQFTPPSIALRVESSDGTTTPLELRTGGDTSSNLFIGNNSGVSIVSGTNNTGFGKSVLSQDTTGIQNTGFGSGALSKNIEGSYNVAVGYQALLQNSVGLSNTAIGTSALSANTSGFSNTGLGISALSANTTGNFNVGLGGAALLANITGDKNSALGRSALQNNKGSFNSALGYASGLANTVGENNTFLGYLANANVGNLINVTAIGANAYVSQDNSLVLGSINGINSATASARIGIGTIAPLVTLDVRGFSTFNAGTLAVASISGQTSFAALVANNDGVGDIFTASKSGLPIFTVKNNGQLVAGAPYYQTGSCTLKTDTAGLVTCGTDLQGGGGGYSPFQELSGAIVPNNSTLDLLVGGQATTSAQFGVLNIAKNQAIATVSGNLIVMPQNGWGGQVGIGTTSPAAGYDLDLRGNAIFGNQQAAGFGGTKQLYISNKTTDINNDNFAVLGSIEANPSAGTSKIYYGGLFNVISSPGNVQNFTGRLVGFQGAVAHNGTGTLTQARGFAGFVSNGGTGAITDAFAGRFGNNNTSTGIITNAYGVYIASPVNSGGGTYNTNYGLYVQDQSNVGVVGSYNVWSDGFNSKNYFAGNVGIGATPSARLQVAGSWGSNAAVIIDQLNSGDILAASASGTTKFVITNAGAINLAGGQTSDIDTLTGTTLNIGATNATTISLGRATQGITLPGFATCTLKTSSGALQCGTDLQGGGGGYSPFQELSGAIVPNNSTLDLLVGGQATTSAQFSLAGIAKNQLTASVSGQLIVMPNNGWGGQVGIGATNPREKLQVVGNLEVGAAASGSKSYRFRTSGNALDFEGSGASMVYSTWSGNDFTGTQQFYLQLFNSTQTVNASGDWRFSQGNNCCGLGNPLLSISGASGGDIGIGTANPLATLDVRPTFVTNGGTIAISSVSGQTSFAALVVDNSGVGDIFTASASGATRFKIAQNGTVTIGNSTDGLVFNPVSGGPIYSGSARPTKKITLSPEYAGAVLTASGSATTTGSMTSDASPSALFRTYYEWSSTQASLQNYTVAVRVTLPQDWSAWDTNSAITINFNTATTNALQNKFDFLLFNSNDASPTTPVVMRTANVSSVAKTWQTLTIPASALTGGTAKWQTAGDVATIYLKMYAGSPAYVQVGDIELNYLSAF